MTTPTIDPIGQLKPKRQIEGISAILLPFDEYGDVDRDAFSAHVRRTAAAGLTPAVNMDTGYAHLIDDELRRGLLDLTRATLGGGRFVAGAFVGDTTGSPLDLNRYHAQCAEIQSFGGTPVIFQSFGLVEQDDEEIVEAYRRIGAECDAFIGFELTTDLAPFGKVYDLNVYRELLQIPQCIGAKHSSFEREPEWQRLLLRDEVRPEFKVYTGNDFAIDMVMYGSDYLLGLSTFCPDVFARRDAYWAEGDPRFYELNDLLQYLGLFAFRTPGPAYKHSAAQFLHLRGHIRSEQTHPGSPTRPESDRAILADILERLEA